MDITGAVLAGGMSRRMGRDKTGITLQGGGTMLQHAISGIYETLWSTPLISGPGGIPDLWKRKGPLGGMATVLLSSGSGAVLFTPCDMPFLSVDLLRRMTEVYRAYPGRPAVVTSPWPEPLLAVVPVAWSLKLANAVDAGHLKVGRFWIDCGFTGVPAGDPSALKDVDLPGDIPA